MTRGGGVGWSALVVVVVVTVGCLFVLSCDAIFNSKSILCDDIQAICSEYGYKDNETECESDEREFLNPDVCNCGRLCVKNLKEGDKCSKYSSSFYPNELCGYGLLCDSSTSVCVRNTAKECGNELVQYEEQQAQGTLGPGRRKPNCDEFGSYAPRQCSPSSTCYCVNKDGKRLFGEALYVHEDTMNCKCSVYWEDSLNKGLNIGMRCTANGNFDELQCIDNKYCFCFDDSTDTVTYGPVYIDMLHFIPCYNKSLHTVSYINPCHQAQELWDSQGGTDDILVAEVPRPVCSADGYYAPVQYLGGMAYCADMNGNRIENYQLPIHEATSMSCNCPRRRRIMEINGFGASKPKCCNDGQYFPWQTRGPHAYCVDENGNQYGETATITNMDSLECYTTTPCSV